MMSVHRRGGGLGEGSSLGSPSVGVADGSGDGSKLGPPSVLPFERSALVEESARSYLSISAPSTFLKIFAGNELPVTLIPWTLVIFLPDG